jgi:NAD+ diphosphatase
VSNVRADALIFAFRGHDLVLVSEPSLPTYGTLAPSLPAEAIVHHVGEWAGIPCYAVALPDEEPPTGLRTIGLRAAHAELGADLFRLAGRAAQLVEWDRTHRFCGRCGALTELAEGEHARRCPACAFTAYPRISPAIMVLVRRGREILLARSPRFTTGMYSALAGFVEAGETLEETVAREVREEVGIDVDGLAYEASQSWPFPHSLMIAFTATYAGGELAPDGVEIEDARWFDIDALPERLPMGFSIAHRLITSTVARMRAGEL